LYKEAKIVILSEFLIAVLGMNKFGWLKNRWFWRGSFFIILLILLIVFIVGVETQFWPSWTGFGADVETSRTSEKNPDGTVTKITETSKNQPGKTLWDILGLLGVPLALAGLGFWYQNLQQKSADEQAKEEVLQAYFDRLSTLLIDKDLIAREKRRNGRQDEQVEASINVIQAWTRSVLRRLGNDSQRKIDVFLFLINTEVLSKLKLDINQFQLKDLNLKEIDFRKTNLEGIDFSGVDLRGVNLAGVILRQANFSGANLAEAKFYYFNSIHKVAEVDMDTDIDYWDHVGTDLEGASLRKANLQGADLRFANLQGADLRQANLKGAIFSGTSTEYDPNDGGGWDKIEVPANLGDANLTEVNLTGANLTKVKFTEANLTRANLSGADLTKANFTGANLTGANLSGAKIHYANFEGANLEGANFQGAFLVEQPADAKFGEANFQGVSFQGAILFRVYLSPAHNLSSVQLTGNNPPLLCKVALPSDIQIDGNRDCEKIFQILKDRYPEQFKTLEDAETYINEL
jgi:uncharacterized protein YjbI with pentapeptide repeats/flagellar basal body-associated protein FliL